MKALLTDWFRIDADTYDTIWAMSDGVYTDVIEFLEAIDTGNQVIWAMFFSVCIITI